MGTSASKRAKKRDKQRDAAIQVSVAKGPPARRVTVSGDRASTRDIQSRRMHDDIAMIGGLAVQQAAAEPCCTEQPPRPCGGSHHGHAGGDSHNTGYTHNVSGHDSGGGGGYDSGGGGGGGGDSGGGGGCDSGGGSG